MAGESKILVFSEGVVVSAPSQNYLKTTSFQPYADDAAFVTAKGSAAAEGDSYGNTTDHHIHYYDGTAWRTVEQTFHNFAAVAAPTVNDDSSGGYSIGSIWIDTANDLAYMCMDSSVGAAVWKSLDNPKNGYAAADPTVNDDNTQGYSINSIWTRTDTDLFFLCADASTGTAVWIQLAKNSDLTTHTGLTAAHGATGAVVGTTNTQTFTNKTFDDAIIQQQIATPANPASSYNKIYPKSDNKYYVLHSDGTEKALGSGTGGGINYIDNPDAESNTNGYATYADAALVYPENGTGGSPNITFTRNTSSPLRDIADFALEKAGSANYQGEGVSYDVTIDSADKANVLTLSFDYAVTSNYADGDIRCYLFDVTNSQVIWPSDPSLLANSLPSTARYQFQTNSDSVAYRICWHVASALSTNWTLSMDNISLGPKEVVRGPAITDWSADFNMTLNSDTNVTSKVGNWKRVGDSMKFRGRIAYGGAGDNSDISVLPPNGLSVDTAKFDYVAYNNQLGYAYWQDNGGTNVHLEPNWNGTTFTFIKADNNQIESDEMSSGDVIHFTIEAPITGWSSNTLMSSDAGNKDIMFNVRKGGGSQTITFGAYRDVIFDTKVTDTTNSLNTTTGIFTVPESGKYLFNVKARVLMGATAATGCALVIYQNSDFRSSDFKTDLVANLYYSFDCSAVIDCVKGDTVKASINSSTTDVTAMDEYCYFSGAKLPSSQTIAQDELVSCRYTSSSGQTINNATNTTVIFENKSHDTHGMMNTSTGEVTIPVAGVYQINSIIRYASSAAWEAGESVYLQIFKNGSVITSYSNVVQTTGTYTLQTPPVVDTLSLVKGDVIKMVTYQESDSNLPLSAVATVNIFTLTKIK